MFNLAFPDNLPSSVKQEDCKPTLHPQPQPPQATGPPQLETDIKPISISQEVGPHHQTLQIVHQNPRIRVKPESDVGDVELDAMLASQFGQYNDDHERSRKCLYQQAHFHN